MELPTPLPDPIVPLSETALIDENAVAQGCALADLMEAAGQELADAALAMASSDPIVVCTGPGNNGGDGWVAARHLAEAGRQVQLWPVVEARTELCQAAANKLPPTVEILSQAPAKAGLIIDALLGAGSEGPLRGTIAEAVTHLQRLDCPCIAADAPTGVGQPLMLPATQTVCFELAKQEVLQDQRSGEVRVPAIGIPTAALTEVQANCLRRFPLLSGDNHKGKHGSVLVLGGGPFPGALELSCRAAAMTGCDLIHAWTTEGPPLPPHIIPWRQPGTFLAPSDADALTARLIRTDALLIGPGLGRDLATLDAARQAFILARDMDVPIVIDADGIWALADELRALPETDVPVVLTPHATELRTLMAGAALSDAELHRFARPDRVLLRKGRIDLITNGVQWQTNDRGNARMTVGGTGDCLAGLTAGFLARGASPFDAARMAVYLLTATADELWMSQGPCYQPQDILEAIPGRLRHDLGPLGLWPPG